MTMRRNGEERLYYSPPAMRRHNQQQQSKLAKSSPLSSPEERVIGPDSYLDRFLEHTTLSVAAQRLPKRSVKSRRNHGNEFHPHFNLGDLWESFREWSVYGVGVPLLCNGSDSVVQYYVPSLSGIQLYIDPLSDLAEQRKRAEESEANSSRDTSSDEHNESGTNRRVDNNTRGPLGSHGGYSRFSGRNKYSFVESCVSGGGAISNPPGWLIVDYFENDLPFHREPLADKMSILAASKFPELKTYRSCDLTPSSWISVAWYPIYRIPVGPTLQNVDACFLTFHSLGKPVRSGQRVHDGSSKLLLPTFGLVPYKFKASDWNGDGVLQSQRVDLLLRAADDWLRRLQVDHPDYNFFMSRENYWR